MDRDARQTPGRQRRLSRRGDAELRALLAGIALCALSATAVAAQPAKPAPPSPAGDPAVQRLTKAIGERFGVTVLKAEPGQIDGHAIYRMVVMNPGGDYNSAFQVRTLVVDAASGELVPAFEQQTSGYRTALPPDRTPREDGVATTIRRESFSKP
jgi:hypothetical protein